MTNIVTTEPELSKEARHILFDLVMDVIALHPEANLTRRYPPSEECGLCERVSQAMKYLDNNQRQYGPAIDVTDPSFNEGQRGRDEQ